MSELHFVVTRHSPIQITVDKYKTIEAAKEAVGKAKADGKDAYIMKPEKKG